MRNIRLVRALENLDQEICKIFLGLLTALIFTKCVNGVGNSVELRATRQKSGIWFATKRGIFLAAKMSGPTHCCTCVVGSGGYAAGLWSSPITCLDLCARIWIRAWSFGCGMGDHGRIPCCSMFRPILGLFKLTFLQILGGAHRIRKARLNIYLFSMSRIGMRAPLHLLTLFAFGTGKCSRRMKGNVWTSESRNFAMYGKWAAS